MVIEDLIRSPGTSPDRACHNVRSPFLFGCEDAAAASVRKQRFCTSRFCR